MSSQQDIRLSPDAQGREKGAHLEIERPGLAVRGHGGSQDLEAPVADGGTSDGQSEAHDLVARDHHAAHGIMTLGSGLDHHPRRRLLARQPGPAGAIRASLRGAHQRGPVPRILGDHGHPIHAHPRIGDGIAKLIRDADIKVDGQGDSRGCEHHEQAGQ